MSSEFDYILVCCIAHCEYELVSSGGSDMAFNGYEYFAHTRDFVIVGDFSVQLDIM